jgi:hypothetical protein
LKNAAIAEIKRKTERFDWRTNLEVNRYQGPTAINKLTKRLNFFFFVTPKARKYEAIIVRIPKIACGKRIENSFRPKREIKGAVI